MIRIRLVSHARLVNYISLIFYLRILFQLIVRRIRVLIPGTKIVVLIVIVLLNIILFFHLAVVIRSVADIADI